MRFVLAFASILSAGATMTATTESAHSYVAYL
jgi:hypothetical protein